MHLRACARGRVAEHRCIRRTVALPNTGAHVNETVSADDFGYAPIAAESRTVFKIRH
jgi:hypothetical protein